MEQHEHIGLAAGIPRRPRREQIEALIERLIGLLDAAEPDLDLEPEEDCCTAHDDDPAWAYFCDMAAGDVDDAEEEDREASLQPPVTPDSTRPTRSMAVRA